MTKELLGLIAEQEQAMGIIQRMKINFRETEKARLTRGYVKARKETLEEYFKNFVETNRAIIKTVNKKDMENLPYFTKDYYSTYEEFYIDLKAEMTDMLDDTAQSRELCFSQQQPSQSEDIKLPEINIPQFTGDYQDWTSFYDLFVTLIHSKPNLSKVQKLHYLKSCLSGEPERLLKQFPITDSNYELAWNMLQVRYNNKRVIVNSILSRLINQKKANTGTAKAIREILDVTMGCLHKLRTQGVDTTSWDAIIIHLIVSKLDTETHKEWEEEVGDMNIHELPSLSKFEKFLEKRFRVLEMTQQTQSTKANTNRNVQKVHHHAIELKSFLAAMELKCTFCKYNHHIFQCREFQQLTLQKKIEIVQNERLCFNCLMPGHPARYCKNKSSCHTCGKRHHTLLHRYHSSSHSHERQIRDTKLERQNGETKHQIINIETNPEIQNNEKYQREMNHKLTEKRTNNETDGKKREDRYGERLTTNSDEQLDLRNRSYDNEYFTEKRYSDQIRNREHLRMMRNNRANLPKDKETDGWRKKFGKTERNTS